ncbi:MAG: GTP cyclohydrolase II [Sphingobium sp.]|nr:GTP cyclohydrolase II [Sphingobium sp.]MBP6111260.1 GTP cyclohydrolase II [Sphingobium sp.]MBP8670296.1 GTP cyclohydrolase II [Sphingobium sp.]MBP9156234.1 GTP cyclohydrolase II [Sphingobium sp.]MCC6483139.1 GTP cyclohydrolase II [Sphingomonadaceae bacterium]
MSAEAAARAVAKAIDALRRGWAVEVMAAGQCLHLLAVESADEQNLPAFDPTNAAPILISAARAHTLHLANQREAADPEAPVLVQRESWIDLGGAMALADPVRDLATPLKGPYRALPLSQPDAAAGALRLARLAGILPAFFVAPAPVSTEASAEADAILVYGGGPQLHIATRARLPVSVAESAEIWAFRTLGDPREHVALVVGARDDSVPVVRLHSECLTGDVLGSLKCDCGPQLHAALHQIANARWGVLLYLRQEGRGIGLINKLRAYALQDQGFDTVDANVRLGFAIDARDFSVAAQMLRLLAVEEVRLLTNNPAKVAGLEAEGVKVKERVPLAIEPNPHNARYLDTKRDRTGHQL